MLDDDTDDMLAPARGVIIALVLAVLFFWTPVGIALLVSLAILP